MQRLEITGNLGSDAEFRSENGNEFVTFSVGCSERYKKADGSDVENTTWHSCIMNGKQENLMPYLKRGTRVFVRGEQRLRVFNSAKNHTIMAGSSVNVREIELIGAKPELVPSQLCDENGMLYNVVKLYWVQNYETSSGRPCVLFNPRRTDEQYNMDANGFVVPVQYSADVIAGQENTRTDNTQKEENAEPY